MNQTYPTLAACVADAVSASQTLLVDGNIYNPGNSPSADYSSNPDGSVSLVNPAVAGRYHYQDSLKGTYGVGTDGPGPNGAPPKDIDSTATLQYFGWVAADGITIVRSAAYAKADSMGAPEYGVGLDSTGRYQVGTYGADGTFYPLDTDPASGPGFGVPG